MTKKKNKPNKNNTHSDHWSVQVIHQLTGVISSQTLTHKPLQLTSVHSAAPLQLRSNEADCAAVRWMGIYVLM